MTTKKNQWRNYADVQSEKQTWEQYKNYLLTLFNNSMIRVINTITIIENVKQLSRQSIVACNQYLVKLWNKLKRHVSNEKRQERLLIKIHVFIRIKCVEVRNHEIDFYFKLVVNLLIAKQLLVDDDILDKSSNNITKTEQNNENDQRNQKNDNDDDNRDKNKETSRNKFAEFDNAQKNNQNQFSTSQQNQQNEKENENRNRDQNFASSKFDDRFCYSCDKSNHIVFDFVCENYAQTQERRNLNQNQSSKKERVWCLSLKHWE